VGKTETAFLHLFRNNNKGVGCLYEKEQLKMRITKREVVFEGKYLQVVRKEFNTDMGEGGTWEAVQRKNIYGRGAVVIVALTKDGEVILERNWRVPLESFVIQFPAGLTDREGENEEETARRELLEETGYRAERLIPIISVPVSPVLTATRAMHFLAPEVEFVGRQGKEIGEEIGVLKIPVDKISDFLLNLPEDTELDIRVPGILWILEKRGLI
jgi:ADP-ribose pyrophosphatase